MRLGLARLSGTASAFLLLMIAGRCYKNRVFPITSQALSPIA